MKTNTRNKLFKVFVLFVFSALLAMDIIAYGLGYCSARAALMFGSPDLAILCICWIIPPSLKEDAVQLFCIALLAILPDHDYGMVRPKPSVLAILIRVLGVSILAGCVTTGTILYSGAIHWKGYRYPLVLSNPLIPTALLALGLFCSLAPRIVEKGLREIGLSLVALMDPKNHQLQP